MRRVEFINQIELSKTDKEEILNLWNAESPEKLNYQTLLEFENYLENLTEQSHILMKSESQSIKGWYFDFIRKNEKWFAIILDSKFHGKGLGTKILNLAKEKESELNGWVIDNHNDRKKNGELYKSPLNFYLKNGFEKLDKERLELEKLSAVKIKWKK
ncbi:GNAT family N-acetyltransferase [Joostella sp. CR20]